MTAVFDSLAREPGYEAGFAEIKSDIRLLEWITGTTLAGVLALAIRVFTS